MGKIGFQRFKRIMSKGKTEREKTESKKKIDRELPNDL
jgi:hypothetical protein